MTKLNKKERILKMKNKEQYGLIENFLFMMKEQFQFDKSAFLYPFLRIPCFIGAAFITVNLPKIVVSSIENSVSSYKFTGQLCIWIAILAVLTYVSYYSEQEIYIRTVKIWNLHFYKNKQWKIVDLDYDIFSTTSGKEKILRGHWALNRNIHVNMVSFYPNFYDLIKNIVGLFIFSGFLILLNPLIVLLLVGTYFLNVLVSFKAESWRYNNLETRVRIERKIDYLQHISSDNNSLKDIIMYNMKDWLFSKVTNEVDDLTNQHKIISKKNANVHLIQNFSFLLRNIIVYTFLIMKVKTGAVSMAEFVLYIGIIETFNSWLEGIELNIQAIISANHKCTDYRKLMNIENTRKTDSGKQLPDKDEPVEISLKNVSFQYPDSHQPILKNVSLDIKKGEKIAIVGENGAGKSTLVKLISGLLIPTSGEILVDNTNITQFNRDEYYQLISAVFQTICLLPASLEKNITLKAHSLTDKKQLTIATDKADILEKINRLPKKFQTELVPSVTIKGINLSGGEQQKLMLARSLYKDSPLLLLDEPTAALDPIAESTTYNRYNYFAQNKTSIFISHRLSSTRFCDKIVYLSNGEIIESGTHKELMTYNGKYRYMFDTQSQYYQN